MIFTTSQLESRRGSVVVLIRNQREIKRWAVLFNGFRTATFWSNLYLERIKNSGMVLIVLLDLSTLDIENAMN